MAMYLCNSARFGYYCPVFTGNDGSFKSPWQIKTLVSYLYMQTKQDVGSEYSGHKSNSIIVKPRP